MTTARLRSSDVNSCNNLQFLMRDFTANRRVILNQDVFSAFGNFQQYVLDKPLSDEEASKFIATSRNLGVSVRLSEDHTNIFVMRNVRYTTAENIERFSFDQTTAARMHELLDNKRKVSLH